MKDRSLILKQTLCSHYNIEISFLDDLSHMGLIQIVIVEHDHFIHHDQIAVLEKIIRLHYDLGVNLEGIDVVFNLLDKERALRNELLALKRRLQLYEDGSVG